MPLSWYTKVFLMMTEIEKVLQILVLPCTAICEVHYLPHNRKLFSQMPHEMFDVAVHCNSIVRITVRNDDKISMEHLIFLFIVINKWIHCLSSIWSIPASSKQCSSISCRSSLPVAGYTSTLPVHDYSVTMELPRRF